MIELGNLLIRLGCLSDCWRLLTRHPFYYEIYFQFFGGTGDFEFSGREKMTTVKKTLVIVKLRFFRKSNLLAKFQLSYQNSKTYQSFNLGAKVPKYVPTFKLTYQNWNLRIKNQIYVPNFQITCQTLNLRIKILNSRITGPIYVTTCRFTCQNFNLRIKVPKFVPNFESTCHNSNWRAKLWICVSKLQTHVSKFQCTYQSSKSTCQNSKIRAKFWFHMPKM